MFAHGKVLKNAGGISNIMDRFLLILITLLSITSINANAEDLSHVIGELQYVTGNDKNAEPLIANTVSEDTYTLLKLANGNTYQLSRKLEPPLSPSIVQLDISSKASESGYPLVVSGRVLSLVSIVDGKKNILSFKDPMEFRVKPSNETLPWTIR
ncbi:MAG: hypothetical protein P8Z77_15490 [Candidatus Thiodiazotropha sp.]